MEPDPPTWLNKEFLTMALKGGETGKHDLEVTNFCLKLAVAPGNNYTSRVYRVNVDYQDGNSPDQQTVSLIVKEPIEKGVIAEFSEKVSMFSTEPKIYETLLPIFSEIMKHEFGPEYFASPRLYNIVLKDLKPEGYVMSDRLRQLDLKHCRAVINYLAKFHAASVSYHHQNSTFVESFKERFYSNEGPVVEEMKTFIDPLIKLLLETLKDKNIQTMAHYVSERLDKIWDTVVEFHAPRFNSLNVLNHGDCWTNNLLFKYDDRGDIEDMKFIDYQMVRYSSPVVDLFYFVWTSGNEDVRDNHQEELYKTYLQILNQTLEELNCPERLSYDELNKDLLSYSDSVLLTIAFVVPFTINDNDEVIDLGKMTSGDLKNGKTDDKYSAMYKSKRFQELLPGYLRQFETLLSSKKLLTNL